MPDTKMTAERIVIAATVILTCVLFTSQLADPVNVIKLTVLVLSALALLLLTVYRVLRDRTIWVPRGVAPLSSALLLIALIASAVAAPTAETAVVGTYGRNSGLLAYLSALVLFFVGLRAWSRGTAHVLLIALMVAGLFTASYGLLQYAGIDSVNWNNPFNPIIAALGNPDFASGYLGICVPAAAWGALHGDWPRSLRISCAVVAALCVSAALLSSAIQGPLAAAAGLTVLALAWLMNRSGRIRRDGLLALGGFATTGVMVLAAGIAKLGPAAGFFSGISFKARTWYWQGALRMFSEHPIAGVGLDHYGVYWREVRPAAATQRQGGNAFSDAAHSVPLQMLAQGGLVLATSYAFFTITVALLLIRGLRKLDGSPRLLLGGVGGAWVAYVVQSIVSIDQVPLLTIQFVAGSAVVGLVGVAAWERRLPGARPISPTRPGRARPREPLKRRDLSGADGAGLAATLAIGLVLAWLALLPLRANAAIHAGDVAVGRGDGTSGLSDYQRANQLLLGSGIYWGKTGELLENVGQPKKAYAVYRRGLLHDPFDLFLIRKAAALADAQHEDSVARTMNRRAVALDPSNPETVLQAAAWATAHGEPKWGLGVLAGPLAIFPDNADMWAAVGDAQRALGAQAQANRAYSRALLLNPQQAAAKAGLAMLTASGPAS